MAQQLMKKGCCTETALFVGQQTSEALARLHPIHCLPKTIIKDHAFFQRDWEWREHKSQEAGKQKGGEGERGRKRQGGKKKEITGLET